MSLTPAQEERFWYWITERHRIYLRRQAGKPKPWTQDPILQTYKFTNVFRELDTGTVWLREHFLTPHRDDPLDLVAFNICWYRAFNWTGTGARLGWQTFWSPEDVGDILSEAEGRGEQVFTGAHIINSDPGMTKIQSVVRICTDLWNLRHEVVASAQGSGLLQQTFRTVMKVYRIGFFQAYEMVSDMRHTRLLETARDINTWANVGPGALRGLRRLKPDVKEKGGLAMMVDLLQRSTLNLPPDIPALELRDIEHSLCEFDKYCRVFFKEGRPRSRYPGLPLGALPSQPSLLEDK